MYGEILKDGLVKILKICSKNGFFNLQSTRDSLLSIQYGPLGSLFTRNLWREWLSSVTNNTDVNMFPIEVLQSKSKTELNEQFSIKSSFLPYAFKNCFKFIPLLGKDIPYGFAIYGPIVDQSLLDNSLLRKLESKSGLCIIFFCPGKKSSDWFNYWARYRYRWWRKFSSTPSKFSMSDVTETKEGNQQISLMMEFPGGKENLETITLYEDSFIKKNCLAFGLQDRKSPIVSSVIVCESELNLAAFAYLSNSFSEKWRDGEVRKLFQLHTRLAPYKVCISINCDVTKNLTEVAKHLEKELKKWRIDTFPSFGISKKNCTGFFSRHDEMGIPYTIVLNEKAISSGIAGLRSRDTTLEEQVHIAELIPKLLKYLQMKSFHAEDS